MPPSLGSFVEQRYADLARGDKEAFAAALAPDAEWHWPQGMADTTVFRGRDEIRRGLDVWDESWADFRMHLVEAIERVDRVLAVVHYSATGRISGAALDETIAHLWEFRDGRPARVRMFADAAKAKERFLRESPAG